MTHAVANRDKRALGSQNSNLKDFKWALGLNQLGAEVLGVWPRERRHSSDEEDADPWYVRLRVPAIIAVLFFWICLPLTWALILVLGNLTLVIDNIVVNTAAWGSCFKLFFLWRGKQAMRPVVESARRDWLRAKSARERKLMLSNASNMRLVTMADYSAMALSFVCFTTFPMLHFDIRLVNNITDHGERHLLVQSCYPFDYSRSPVFELTQGLQIASTLFASLAVTVPENYFGALAVHLGGQFRILARQLEQLFPGGPVTPGTRARLGGLIRRHVHLVAMVRTLEYSFSYVTLAQVFFTSVILCSYGFQVLAIIDATSEQLPLLQMVTLLAVMSTLMLHTLVDCVVGETLTRRSTSLIGSIYRCKWYAIDGKRARDLVPMMIMSRTQKPLMAGNILPLSLATYCAILKTTAGYISMLVAVSTK